MHYTESIFFFQGLRTCVLPLPVCPYAKQVAIPRSNIHSTSGFAVYLEENTEHCCLKSVQLLKLQNFIAFNSTLYSYVHIRNIFVQYLIKRMTQTCRQFRCSFLRQRRNQIGTVGSRDIGSGRPWFWVRG